jgi:hypothetical protein
MMMTKSQGNTAARALMLAVAMAAIALGAAPARADWQIFDHPDAVRTFPRGVDGKRIVGSYQPTADDYFRGFLYDGKTWTDLMFPGAKATEATGISGRNIVGFYSNDPIEQDWHGFVYDGKRWTSIDFPGAETTHAFGIDDHTVVGAYWDGRNDHGFVHDGKKWATLDYPGAIATFVSGAEHHRVAGDFLDTGSGGRSRGFLYDRGQWTVLDGGDTGDTYLWGLAGGIAVGTWDTPGGTSLVVASGYVYDVKRGKATLLAFPGAAVTEFRGTDGKTIAGFVVIGDSEWHGVLYRAGHGRGKADDSIVGSVMEDD